MRHITLILFITLLGSCGGRPHAASSVHEIGDSEFHVLTRGNRAEIRRLSPEIALSFQPIALKAAYAAELASGCRAAWVQGDLHHQQVGLSCDGAPPAQMRAKPGSQCALHNYDNRTSIQETDMTCNTL
jgi:hypothetical protein